MGQMLDFQITLYFHPRKGLQYRLANHIDPNEIFQLLHFILTFCTLMNSSIWFDTMNQECFIVHMKGSHKIILKLRCTSIPMIIFILANSADADEMPQTLMKCRILWHFISVCTVCQSTHLHLCIYSIQIVNTADLF